MILNDTVAFLIQLLNHIKNHQPLSFREWVVVICFVVWCIGVFIYMNKGFSVTGNNKKAPDQKIIIRIEHVTSPDAHAASSGSQPSPPRIHTPPEHSDPESTRPMEKEAVCSVREDSCRRDSRS